MVETHYTNYKEEDIDAQKIEFFDTDVHIGNYDIRFDFGDKKFFSKTHDNLLNIRVHTEPRIICMWLLLEDPKLTSIEIINIASTSRFNYWEIQIPITNDEMKFSFAAKNSEGAGIYYGKSGVSNFISPSEKWVYVDKGFNTHEIPEWVFGGVMYQVFPERFLNGKKDLDKEGVVKWGSTPHRLEHQGGDLYGVIDKLDYIKKLGINIIYLNPIFLSTSIHRYDTWDHKKVDPTLGGEDALRELVSKAHQKGMKVILDASLNHVHPRNFAFQDVVENGDNSEYADWFTIYDYPVRLKYRPHLYSETHKVGWDGDEEQYRAYLEDITFKETNLDVEIVEDDGPIVEPTFKAWWGVPDMVKVNMRSDGAREWGLGVIKYWIEKFDVDGWRMDVAKEIDLSFWEDFRNAARSKKKDVLLFAEIFGDTSLWLQGDKFDAPMNYTFREVLADYFASKSITTQKFAEELANLYMMYSFEALSCCQNLLSSHDVPRFLHRTNGDKGALKASIFLQATFPGVAGIYYGDEVGLDGAGEPKNREAFPWHKKQTWDEELLKWTTELMGMKSNNEILRKGYFQLIGYQDTSVAYRRVLNNKSLICIVNGEKKLKKWEIPTKSSNAEKIWGLGNVDSSKSTVVISELDTFCCVIIED